MFIRKLLLASLTLLLLQSCYVTRAYKYRKFQLDDLKEMDAVTLTKSSEPFQFKRLDTVHHKLAGFLDSNLQNSKTYAFLVIKNDTILYERYFGQVDSSTFLPSFSVAKSFVATLVEMALEEGRIKSLDEPITNYLPTLKERDERFAQITIQHVLDMRSGIKSNENYGSPFSDVLKLGFTKNMHGKMKHLKIEKAPGEFEYKSVNTQVLAMIVEAATGKKLQDYMHEKLWLPLGMESDATWNIDSKKHNTTRAFCCLNATAKDFAKLGRLYLHKGNWNGKQLISEQWVNNTTAPNAMIQADGYKNQWWGSYQNQVFDDSLQAVAALPKAGCSNTVKSFTNKKGVKQYWIGCAAPTFHAEGILGQYIYVNPTNNVIIVRLGYYWSHPRYYVEPFIYSVGAAFK